MECQSSCPPLSIRSDIYKKATVIFNDQADTNLSAKPEVPFMAHQIAKPEVPISAHQFHFDDMDSHSVKNPRHYKSQPQLRKEKPLVFRRTQSRHFGHYEEFDKYDDNDTEAGALEHLPEHSPQTTEASDSNTPGSGDKPVASVSPSVASSNNPPILPAAYDFKEYWDEDEDEEFYEEQGHTTAHPCGSHGDNTTGEATTLVTPKVTANVQQEGEIAKAIVQDSRAEDEIEEEALDGSIFAEYSEEIFQYMKSLEVRHLGP